MSIKKGSYGQRQQNKTTDPKKFVPCFSFGVPTLNVPSLAEIILIRPTLQVGLQAGIILYWYLLLVAWCFFVRVISSTPRNKNKYFTSDYSNCFKPNHEMTLSCALIMPVFILK